MNHRSHRDLLVIGSPLVSSGGATGLRPFVIAAVVFLLLLVGAEVAAGYYASHVAKQKTVLPQNVPVTVPNTAGAKGAPHLAAPGDVSQDESSRH
jgi:hypothetical protein